MTMTTLFTQYHQYVDGACIAAGTILLIAVRLGWRK